MNVTNYIYQIRPMTLQYLKKFITNFYPQWIICALGIKDRHM